MQDPKGIKLLYQNGTYELFEGVYKLNVSGLNFRDIKTGLLLEPARFLVLVKDEDSVDFFIIHGTNNMAELERFLRATDRKGAIDFIELRPL